MVQWLRLCAPYQEACVPSLVGGARSHILQVKIPHAATKIEDPCAVAKTWHSQTKNTHQTSLQHVLNEHMLRTYYVPGTVRAGHTGMNMRGKVWTLRELTVGREDRW